MNKKFLFKCVVALSAITPAAIVSIVEEPVVVQAQTQEQSESQEHVQTGNFTTIDNVRVGQTRYSGYADGGSSVEIYNERTDQTVEVPLLNGRFSYDLPAPKTAENDFHHYTLKDSNGNVLDAYRHLPQGGHGVGNIDLTKASFKLEEVTPNSVSGTVATNRSYNNQSAKAWNVDKQTNDVIEKSSSELPSNQATSKFTVDFKKPLTQNSKLQLFVEGSYNSSSKEAVDAFGNPHTYRTDVSTIENLNIVGDPVYPEPATPEVTPEPVTPEVTPETVTPEVTVEPVIPEVTAEPEASETTSEPVAETTIEPDAAETTSEPDATETTSEPDATETTSEPDATETTSEPDATETTSEPDATETTSEPDATETTSEPDATETTAEPDAAETTSEPATTETTSETAASETATEPVIDEAKAKEEAKAQAEAKADKAPVVDEAKAKEEAKAKAEGKTATKDSKAKDTKSDKAKAADPKADAKKADDNKAAGLPKTGANTILAGLGLTTALAGVATLSFNRKRK